MDTDTFDLEQHLKDAWVIKERMKICLFETENQFPKRTVTCFVTCDL